MLNNAKEILLKAQVIIIYLLSFFIPVHSSIVTFLIAALLIAWLLEGGYIGKFRNILSHPFSILFAGLFLIFLFGLIYSHNIKFGLFDLEIKLSLLIFPLIFFSFNGRLSENLDFPRLLNIYILGCIAASVVCLCNSYYKFFLTGNSEVFYYKDLSAFYHPSYFAMYLCFGIAAALFYLLNLKGKENIPAKLKYCIIIISLFLMVVLLGSKAGLITLGLALILNLIYYALSGKKYLKSFAVLIIFSAFIFLLLRIFPLSLQRASHTTEVLTSKSGISSASSDGTSNRIMIWKISVDLIKNNPIIGYGTGDVKDVLMKKYKENNMTFAFDNRLNAHNQYLQTLIATGFAGFIILAFCLILPLINAFRKRNVIYIIFLLIIIVNIAFESMLEVQGGVVFYAFFNSLLFIAEKYNIVHS